ncbi:hypothetical protein Hanom_Chr06g00571271 [Helianthus anomalus]
MARSDWSVQCFATLNCLTTPYTLKEQTCYWMVTEDGFYVTRHPDQFPGGGPTKLHDWS